jgi:hypothetical protein
LPFRKSDAPADVFDIDVLEDSFFVGKKNDIIPY